MKWLIATAILAAAGYVTSVIKSGEHDFSSQLPAAVASRQCEPAAPAYDAETITVSAVIRGLLKTNRRHHLYRDDAARNALAAEFVQVAREWDIPLYLLVASAYKESTFRPNVAGKLGEQGLLQLHGPAAEGCDFSTTLGQLQCGARYLSASAKKCGDLRDAVARYMSGGCNPSEGVYAKVDARLLLQSDLEQAAAGSTATLVASAGNHNM